MTAAELIIVRPLGLSESELFLLLADTVYVSRLSNGRLVRDAPDLREWLLELAWAAKIEGEVLGDPTRPARETRPTWDQANEQTVSCWRALKEAVRKRLHSTCPRCGHVHKEEKGINGWDCDYCNGTGELEV